VSAVTGTNVSATARPRLSPDHQVIADLIPDGCRVLDLGCGEGDLLAALMELKHARAEGIEISDQCIQACVARGVANVQHGDLEAGLSDYSDQSVDYVILTNTLQVLYRPLALIGEMARVGKQCIVSFPNFAHWRARAQLMFGGRMPKTRRLPYEWYDTPNIHLTTIRDFRDLCARADLRVLEEVALRTAPSTAARVHLLPNLLADQAVFLVSRTARSHPGGG
jgi:methionine biosynthesis protein MetW